jgi:hypothetical protein
VRAVVRGLEPILMRYALALRGARPLGLVQLPEAYRNDLPEPSPLFDFSNGSRPQARTVPVAAIGYRFPGIAWDDETGMITVRVTGTPASAVAMIGAFFKRGMQRDGSVTFRIDAERAGEATLILVNGGRAQRNVRITASR